MPAQTPRATFMSKVRSLLLLIPRESRREVHEVNATARCAYAMPRAAKMLRTCSFFCVSMSAPHDARRLNVHQRPSGTQRGWATPDARPSVRHPRFLKNGCLPMLRTLFATSCHMPVPLIGRFSLLRFFSFPLLLIHASSIFFFGINTFAFDFRHYQFAFIF